MALDPSIALAVRSPQIDYSLIQSPVQQLGQVLTLKNLMQQQQMGQLEYQKALLQWQELQNYSQHFAEMFPGHTQPGITPSPTAAPVAPSLSMAPGLPGISYSPQQGLQPAMPAAPAAPFSPVASFTPVAGNLSSMMTGSAAPAADTTQGAAPAPAPGQPQAGTPTGTITTPAEFPVPDFRAMQKYMPTTWMQMADTYSKGAKNFYDAQTAQLTYQKGVGEDVAKLAGRLAADPTPATQLAIVSEARQKHYITDQEADRLMSVSPTADVWKQWQQQGMSASESAQNQIAQSRLHMDQITKAIEVAKAPFELKKLQGEADTATTAAVAARRAQEAQTLNAAWQQDAAARQQGQESHAVETVYNGLPADSKQFFAGVTAPGGYLTRALTAPEAVAAAETKRAHDAEMIREAIKTGQDTVKFNLQYGSNTVPSLIEQVYHNPDTADQLVPQDMRTAVQNGLQAKYGVTFPNPLDSGQRTQETGGKATLRQVNSIRQDLDDPEVAANVGAIMGKFQDVREKFGTAIGLSPAAAQKAQDLRTQMHLLMAPEAKEFGARVSPGIMDELQKNGVKANVNIDMLKGALDGTETATKNLLDTIDQSRFGGQMRPRTLRGLEPTQQQHDFIMSQKKPSGSFRLSDGTTWYLTKDGRIIPGQ